MVSPGPEGSKGRKRSEGQARLGAVFVWSSIAVLLLCLAVLFSYAIVDAGSGLTEEDFNEIEEGTWSAEIKVSDFGTISGTVRSHEDNIRIVVTVYDTYGDKIENYDQKTPVAISVQVYESGTYEIEIEVLEEGKTIEDLDISISAAGFDVLFLCCGLSSFGVVFLALLATGFILLLVSISTRRRELYPPRPVMRYPPPPPPYYGMGYPGGQMYPPPPYYPPFRGNQNEGYLGYDGPPRVVQRGRYEDDRGVGPW
ncbi:MAG: hypothetical protein ACMUHM_05555 [Thermoplasmatota archaeon]